VVLPALASREQARCDGVRTDEFAHDLVHTVDGEKVVVLAFGQEHILAQALSIPSRECCDKLVKHSYGL
jgi:hypothetical protein